MPSKSYKQTTQTLYCYQCKQIINYEYHTNIIINLFVLLVFHTLVRMLANDTKFLIDMSVQKDMEKLPKDIDRLGRSVNQWQLTFNASTCTVMHIG